VNRQPFLSADKIQYATSCLAISEANPAVLGETHTELGRIVTGVKRTRTAKAISASMQAFQQAVSG
jgi:hypothetical protein